MAMIKKLIYLSPEISQKARDYAAAREISVSAVIRLALVDFFEKREKNDKNV